MIRVMPLLSEDEIERIARKRAGAKLGWYIHAAVYVVVNLALFAASQYGFGQRPWSVIPVLGWGLGLALHGISVFMLGTDSAFRERLVRRERERLQRGADGP
jgi:2TM domain